MDIKHIRDIREDNDMTQAQIAKILNISQRAYSYYETGQHNIPLNILCQLADYYKEPILKVQNNISSVADVSSLIKETFKDILQELMETESDAAPGYEKN